MSTPSPTDPQRQAFEAWITAMPYECVVTRFPADPELCAWPGHYRDDAVQIAWEAWCEALSQKGAKEQSDPKLDPPMSKPTFQCPKCGWSGDLKDAHRLSVFNLINRTGANVCPRCLREGYHILVGPTGIEPATKEL